MLIGGPEYSDQNRTFISHSGNMCAHWVHTYIHIYIHTYTHTYIHTYIDGSSNNRCMHTYILTDRQTYIHTYIHTYIPRLPSIFMQARGQ